MNIVAVPSTSTLTSPPLAAPSDEAWWIELFGWKAACEEPCEAEAADDRLMRQASLLALLSVA